MPLNFCFFLFEFKGSLNIVLSIFCFFIIGAALKANNLFEIEATLKGKNLLFWMRHWGEWFKIVMCIK